MPPGKYAIPGALPWEAANDAYSRVAGTVASTALAVVAAAAAVAVIQSITADLPASRDPSSLRATKAVQVAEYSRRAGLALNDARALLVLVRQAASAAGHALEEAGVKPVTPTDYDARIAAANAVVRIVADAQAKSVQAGSRAVAALDLRHAAETALAAVRAAQEADRIAQDAARVAAARDLEEAARRGETVGTGSDAGRPQATGVSAVKAVAVPGGLMIAGFVVGGPIGAAAGLAVGWLLGR